MRTHTPFACSLLVLALVGCVEAAPPSDGLPRVYAGEDECGSSSLPSLPLCEWAASQDALVIARVDELAPVSAPYAYTDSSGEAHTSDDTSACGDELAPGLRLSVSVVDVWRGSAPERLDVHIGQRQLSAWHPRPALADDGQLEWFDGLHADALAPGQLVGLALVHDEVRDLWSTAGDELFAFPDGSLAFQSDGAPCSAGRPGAELQDLNQAAAKERVEACDEGTAERREARQQWIENGAPWAFGGRCNVALSL